MTNRTFPDSIAGQSVIFLESVGSTNDYAKELLAERMENRFLVVVADHQKSGKGRRSNVWVSREGKDLSFSIVLSDFGLPVAEKFLLTKLSSISIIRSFQRHFPGDKWKIKWPNDIFFGNDKIGGILIENFLQGSNIESSIIGIGLNINSLDHPTGRTSLAETGGREFNRGKILEEICSDFILGILNLTPEFKQELHSIYSDNLYGPGMEVEMEGEPQKLNGVFKGVEPGGELVLEKNGSILKLSPDMVFGLNFTEKKIQ